MDETEKQDIRVKLIDMSLMKVGASSNLSYPTVKKARDGGDVMPIVWVKLARYFDCRKE